MKGKRVLSLFLAIVMLFSITAGVDFSAYALSDSGSCGNSAKYTFNSTTGELVISGTGEIVADNHSGSPFVVKTCIKSVVINSGITNTGDSTFMKCTNLTRVSLPDSLEKIGSYSFSRCHLYNLTIPNGVVSIGREAFTNNQSLLNVTIPESVKNIGYLAFSGCIGLKRLTIPNGVNTIETLAFSDCTGLNSVIIPNSVEQICDYAFSGCTGLESVTIPDSIDHVSRYAFSGCKGLKSVIFPTSVTEICDYAFYNCESISDVYYLGSEEEWENVLIGYKNNFINSARKHFNYVPSCEEHIPTQAVQENLVEATCEENGSYDKVVYCSNCGEEISRENVTIPAIGHSFNNDEQYCQNGCGAENPDYTETVTASGKCGDNAYWSYYESTGLLEITGSGAMTNYSSSSNAPWYSYRSNIKTVTIENSVTSIGDYAFDGCTGLTSVTIPNSVTSIGAYAFRTCTSLTSVTIPNSVTSIGDWAFSNCTSLTSVTIPNSVTSIGSSAFFNCTSLTAVNVDSNNQYYSSQDGVLFDKDKTTLIQYPIGNIRTSYTIPNSVTSIGANAFDGCTGLTSVTIGNSVTSIGDGAFWGCTSLTSVTIPNSVTSIGKYAFYECESSTSVTIGNSVTSIGYAAFSHCSSLTSVTIGNKDCAICDSEDTIDSGAKIIGYAGSTAEKYAKKYGREFEAIKEACIHANTTVVGAKDATCTTAGYTGDTVCADCDETIAIGTEVEALGHSYKSETIAPTCTEDGYTNYTCTLCGENIIDDFILALGHRFVDDEQYCQNGCGIENPNYNIKSGKLGGDIEWTFNIETGELVITGTGAINDYSWGESPFYELPVTSVVIGSGITKVGNSVFTACHDLVSVELGDTIEIINGATFRECTSLKNIILPDGLKTISTDAFRDCTALESIVIPRTVDHIDPYAFSNCTSLKTVELTNGTTGIHFGAFNDCGAITTVIYDGTAQDWENTRIDDLNDDLKNAQRVCKTHSFGDNRPTCSECGAENPDYSAIKSGKLNNDIEWTFNIETGELVITGTGEIPSASTSDDTFIRQNGLDVKSIVISEGITSIGSRAFMDCPNLTEVTIADGVTVIGHDAFANCTSLATVHLPNSVENMDLAFSNCGNITDVYYDGTIAEWNAISNECDASIDKATIHCKDGDIKVAGDRHEGNVTWTFDEETGVLTISGTGDMPNYHNGTASDFSDLNIKKIIVEEGVTSIGDFAFVYQRNLESVVLPDGIEYIGESAFDYCTSLKEISIPDSVIYIGDSAFSAAYLSDVYYNGFEEQWNNIFIGENNENLTNANIHFVKSGTLDNGNEWSFDTETGELTITGNGKMCDNNVHPWDEFADKITSVVIGEGITSVDQNTFGNADNLTTVTLPSTVTNLNGAFYGVDNLESINIPNIETWLNLEFECWEWNPLNYGTKLYVDGELLTDLVVPDSVESINDFAFINYKELKSIYISSSVNSISPAAFAGCTNATSVIVDAENTVYDSRNNCNAIIETATNTLHSGFAVTEIPNDIEVIGIGAYFLMDNLTEIDIPNSVKTICGSSFDYTGLDTVVIPRSVEVIEGNAFRDSPIKNIYILNNECVLDIASFTGLTVDDTVVYGYNGSTAQAFAEEHKYEFVALYCDDDTHEYVAETITEVSCEQDGVVRYTCSVCRVAYEEIIPATGHNYEFNENVNPDCENDGYTEYICVNCGDSYRDVIPASGHSFDVAVTQPNCQHGGYTTYTCIVCDYSYVGDETPIAPHDYAVVQDTATCTSSGYAIKSCSVCGDIKAEASPAKGHSFDDTEEFCENGCGTANPDYKPFVSSGTCGDDLSWSIDKNGELNITGNGDMDSWDDSNAPWNQYAGDITNIVVGEDVTSISKDAFNGCDNVESITILNRDCDIYDDANTLPADATIIGYRGSTAEQYADKYGRDFTPIVCDVHTYVSSTVEPSCTDDGYTKYTCIVCSEEYREVIPALGHSFTNYEISDEGVQATCQTQGRLPSRTAKCNRCDATNVILGAETGLGDHIAAEPVQENVVESTCTEYGTYDSVVRCSVCDTELSREHMSFTEYKHNYQVVIDNSDCTNQGFRVDRCYDCGKYNTYDVPARGHTNKVVERVEPTCTTNGYINYVCEVCSATSTEILEPVDHVLTDAVEENKVNPTCTENGFVDYVYYCSTCNAEQKRETKPINALGHSYTTAITQPTCTKKGYTTYTCTRCLDAYDDDYTDALGHSFTNYVSNNDAVSSTCTATGMTASKTAKCDRCDATDTINGTVTPIIDHSPATAVEENVVNPNCTTNGSYDSVVYCKSCKKELSRETVSVNKLGHNYTAVVTNPTCLDKGYTTYTCTRCLDSYASDYTNALGHSFTEYVSNNDAVSATCTATGLTASKTAKCDRCDATDTINGTVTPIIDHSPATAVEENVVAPNCTTNGSYDLVVYCKSCKKELSRESYSVNMLGHNYTAVVTNPTCLDKGYTTYTCTRCLDSYASDYTNALGHSFTNYVSNNDAVDSTCTSTGMTASKTAKCDRCDATDTINGTSIPLKDHVKGMAIEENRVDPSCTANGSHDLVKYCTQCGKELERKTSIINMVGHEYEQISSNVTCEKGGEIIYQCRNCDESYVSIISAKGHNFGAWTITVAPTCYSTGMTVRSCKVCAITESKELAKAEHSPVSVPEKAPSCLATGLTAGEICSVCGTTISGRNIIAKLSHNYVLDESASRPASCTETGTGYYKCTMCGDSYISVLSMKPHDYTIIDHVDSTANERGYDVFKCKTCTNQYTDWLPYASDNSALIAAVLMASIFKDSDFSKVSYDEFKGIYDSCKTLADANASQEDIDAAISNIITAMQSLVPYADVNVFSKIADPTVTYDEESYTDVSYSILYGTFVTVSAPEVDGYRFDSWYDTKSKRVLSNDSEYSFFVSTNLTMEARYSPITSSTLTFANESGQISDTITMTVDEWAELGDISGILPEVPFSFGKINGEWVYDNDEVIAKLTAGEDVTIIPRYDVENEVVVDKPENDSDFAPVGELSFVHDWHRMKGSYIMQVNIPKNCRVNSIGIAFKYDNKNKFDPTQYMLTLNNKNVISQFNPNVLDDVYIVNTTTTNGHNWAAVGYITYFDEDGKLVTYYTNQVNVVDNTWIR